MKNIRTILHLTNNLLRYEWRDLRVVMGFLAGMNVPQAFAATFLCFFLYVFSMGLILYTFHLLLGGVWGIVIAFIVHISGYELPFSGRIGFSLMEYARPGNFADSSGVHLMRPLTVMLVLAAVLVLMGTSLIRRVDFRGR